MPEQVSLANYWPVVALVLKRYEPAAVAGLAAIRLHLEDFSPREELPAYQRANHSEYALILHPGFRLRLRPRTLDEANVVTVTAPGNVLIPVQSAADILTTLDEGEVTAGLEPISAWLRHLVVRTPDLEAAVEKNPRPVIMKRLANLSSELHNEPLARQLGATRAPDLTSRDYPLAHRRGCAYRDSTRLLQGRAARHRFSLA
jgi:hypothetical protein